MPALLLHIPQTRNMTALPMGAQRNATRGVAVYLYAATHVPVKAASSPSLCGKLARSAEPAAGASESCGQDHPDTRKLGKLFKR